MYWIAAVAYLLASGWIFFGQILTMSKYCWRGRISPFRKRCFWIGLGVVAAVVLPLYLWELGAFPSYIVGDDVRSNLIAYQIIRGVSDHPFIVMGDTCHNQIFVT